MRLPALLRPSLLASVALHGGLVAAAYLAVEATAAAPAGRMTAALAYDDRAVETSAVDAAASEEVPAEVPAEVADGIATAPEVRVEAPEAEPEAVSGAPAEAWAAVAALPTPPVGVRSGRAAAPAAPATAGRPAAERGGGAATQRFGLSRPSRPSPENVRPAYPPSALARGQEGVVWLLVTVAEDGAVAEASVDRTSGDAALDDAALSAARSWRYVPALAAGVPVAERLLVPVRFVLRRS